MLWAAISVAISGVLILLLLVTQFLGIRQTKVLKDLYFYQVFDLRPFPKTNEITSKNIQRTLKRFFPYYGIFDYSAIQFELPRWMQAFMILVFFAILWIACLATVAILDIEEFDVVAGVVITLVSTVLIILITLILTVIFMDSFSYQYQMDDLNTKMIESPEKEQNMTQLNTDRQHDVTWNDLSILHKTNAFTDQELFKGLSPTKKGQLLSSSPNQKTAQRGTDGMKLQLNAMLIFVICALGIFWCIIVLFPLTDNQILAAIFMFLLGVGLDIPLRLLFCVLLALLNCTPPYHQKHQIQPIVSVSDLRRFGKSPMKNRDPLLDGLGPEDLLVNNRIGINTPLRHFNDHPTPPLISPAEISFTTLGEFATGDKKAKNIEDEEFIQIQIESQEPEGEGEKSHIEQPSIVKKYKFDRGSPHPNAVLEIDPAGGRNGTPDYPGQGGLSGNDEPNTQGTPQESDYSEYIEKSVDWDNEHSNQLGLKGELEGSDNNFGLFEIQEAGQGEMAAYVSQSKNQTPNSKLHKGKSPNKTDIMDAKDGEIYLDTNLLIVPVQQRAQTSPEGNRTTNRKELEGSDYEKSSDGENYYLNIFTEPQETSYDYQQQETEESYPEFSKLLEIKQLESPEARIALFNQYFNNTNSPSKTKRNHYRSSSVRLQTDPDQDDFNSPNQRRYPGSPGRPHFRQYGIYPGSPDRSPAKLQRSDGCESEPESLHRTKDFQIESALVLPGEDSPKQSPDQKKKGKQTNRKKQEEAKKRKKSPAKNTQHRRAPRFQESGKSQFRQTRSYPLRRRRGNDSSNSSEGMQTPRNARRRNRKSGKSILDDIRSASESEISIIEPVDPNHRGRPHKKASLLNSQYNKKQNKELSPLAKANRRKKYAEDNYMRTQAVKKPRKKNPKRRSPDPFGTQHEGWGGPYNAWEPQPETGDSVFRDSHGESEEDNPMFGGRIYGARLPQAEEDILAKQISPTGAEEAGIFFPQRKQKQDQNAEEGTIFGRQEDERMRTMQELLNMANDRDDQSSRDAKRLTKMLKRREKQRKKATQDSWLYSYDHPYKELLWLMIKDEEKKQNLKQEDPNSPGVLQKQFNKSSSISPVRLRGESYLAKNNASISKLDIGED